MKQEEVFKKIGAIIKELGDQYEYLGTLTGDLNDLELELFVSNAHFLTDHLEILRKINEQSVAAKKTIEKIEPADRKYFEPVVQQVKYEGDWEEAKTVQEQKPVEIEITNFTPGQDEPVPDIDLTSQAPEDTYSFIREEPEIIRHELTLDDSENWEDDEYHETVEPDEAAEEATEVPVVEEKPEPAAKVEEPVATVIKPKEEEPVAPVIKPKKEEIDAEDVLTINQKLSAQLGDKAAGRTEQLNGSPISDIKEAVTLNDKLLFVKDLFNGYSLAYTEAVEILNRFTTFEEASRFLKTNYVTKNNWEAKPATTEKFYALLKRRYA